MKLFRLLTLTAILVIAQQFAFAQQLTHVLGDLLVKPVHGVDVAQLIQEFEEFEGRSTQIQQQSLLSAPMNVYLWSFDYTNIHEGRFLDYVYGHPQIELAQFNLLLTERVIPDDPQFDLQWQWLNPGGAGSLADADIDADEAWDITTGGTTANGHEIVVCVVEGGGANQNHPDLEGNNWFNEAEIPGNNIDDDGNGYVDDYEGWNPSQNNDNIPGGNHGTAVSGMIGAKGNNGIGVTGINWDVKIMQVTVGGLNQANVIAAYTYPMVLRERFNETNGEEGALVVAINSSWGIDGGDPNGAPLWCAFYDTLGTRGILSCGATANVNWNIDVVGDLPTACPSEYMISVTATNNDDIRDFSAFGVENVDVGAPGSSIYSLTGNGGYNYTSGTSFASPTTAGVIALMYSAPCPTFADMVLDDPQGTAVAIRDYLYDGVDPLADLDGFVATGGRINAHTSLQLLMDNCGPCPAPTSIELTSLSETEVNISFAEPSSAESLTIRFREENAGADWDTLSGISNPFVLDGLVSCQEYEFQLLSVCADTLGEFTNSIVFQTQGCCSVPEGLVLESVGDEEATFSWGDVFAAQSYTFQFREIGDPDWTTLDITDNTIELVGLNACTGYEIQLESTCAADSTSGFSDMLTVFTDCICNEPVNLDTIFTTIHTAEVVWDEMVNASSYTVRYRRINVPIWTEVVVNTNSVVLEELDSCFVYRVQVRTDCSITDSGYTDSFGFKTRCEAQASSVLDLENGIGLEVFPTLVTNQFWVRYALDAPQVVELKVITMDGRVVTQRSVATIAAGEQTLSIERTEPMASGVYLVQLELESGQRVVKRVVMQ